MHDEDDRWAEFERLAIPHAGRTLHTRPLQTLHVTREALWYFTDRASAKAAGLREDFPISVGHADVCAHRFAAVCGVGRLHVDAALAQDPWQLDQKDGPEDVRLAFLEVSVERAAYWLAPGRSACYLAALRVTLTGQPVTTIGENRKL